MVAIGIAKTRYNGWGYPLLLGISGDMLYEMVWIWFVGGRKVYWPVWKIAIATFILTALIEVSQLLPFPDAWTTLLWWRLLIGTHFSWPDFLYYAVGCILGGLGLRWLRRRLDLWAPFFYLTCLYRGFDGCCRCQCSSA